MGIYKKMKFLFVCMGAENLAAEQISAILKQKGHEVDLVFDPALFDDKTYFYIPWMHKLLNNRKKLIKRIVDSKADIIGFTVFTDNYKWACDVAKEVRLFIPTPIIFGGIYPTSCPDEVMEHDFVDMVCVGEGEEAVPELVENLDLKKPIDNIWYKKDGQIIKGGSKPLVDLETLPYYDKTLFEKEIPMNRVYLTVASKGCPCCCSFCSQNFLKKFNKCLDMRRRSVDNVIKELKLAKAKYGYKEVDFKDNIFTTDKKWTLEFLKRYKEEIGVPYRALSHVLFMDKDIAQAMKDSGCHRVQFGIQSMHEETRKKHLLRFETNEQIKKALRACDEVGLYYSCDHMFGLPGEKEEHQVMATKFYKSLKCCTRVTCFWTTFFPKTALVDKAQEMGIINEEDIKKINKSESGYYYAEGSINDKELKKTFRSYQMLFRIMPILSERMIDWILKRRWHRYLYLIPQKIPLLLIDVIVSFAKWDNSAFQYMHYYWLQIKKKVMRQW